jgi:hypothetical protein
MLLQNGLKADVAASSSSPMQNPNGCICRGGCGGHRSGPGVARDCSMSLELSSLYGRRLVALCVGVCGGVRRGEALSSSFSMIGEPATERACHFSRSFYISHAFYITLQTPTYLTHSTQPFKLLHISRILHNPSNSHISHAFYTTFRTPTYLTHCAKVIQCTYTNLDSTAYYTLRYTV